MKIYGNHCKFATNTSTYSQSSGTHKNLNLKGGNYGCAMPKKVGLYDCGGKMYQNFKRCSRECRGKCKAKLVTLSSNPCSYYRNSKINGKRFVPL